jgi:hypothetical protein
VEVSYMPTTIFDAQAAEAERRDAECCQVLEEMQVLVTTRPRSQSGAVEASESVSVHGHARVTDYQVQELADLEARYVIEGTAWTEQLADMALAYTPGAFRFQLWWRASRVYVHRLAAVEALPEFIGRLCGVFEQSRLSLAREVMRTIPGGRTAYGLLRAIGPHIYIDTVLETLRTGIVEAWHATDPTPLFTLVTLPFVAPGERTPDRLFGWSAHEVATWLEAHHCKQQRDLSHVATVLAAGGWREELGQDVFDWVENTRKAIAREEEWRVVHPPSSLFNR